MKCSKCGNELGGNDLFCGKCGNKIKLDKRKNVKSEESKESKNKRNKTIIFIITITLVFIIVIMWYIRNSEDNIFSNIMDNLTTNENIDVELSKMRDFIERNNNKNTSEYQNYLADLQKINYIGYKPINPPEPCSIDCIKIFFVEKYGDEYIYKFQTTKDIQHFNYSRQAHTPGQTYSYVKPVASIGILYKPNTDYYFAKNINSNKYIKVEKRVETDIFENEIFTISLENLKGNPINTKNAQNTENSADKYNNTINKKNTLNYQEVSATNKSAIYQAYLATIRSYKEENENYSVEYALIDINNDDIQELIIMSGTSNADYIYDFYTYDINRVRKLGYSNNGIVELYKMNDGKYLKQIRSSMGYQTIWKIKFENDDFSILELYTQEVGENDEYEEGDELITFYKNDSLEALEILNK